MKTPEEQKETVELIDRLVAATSQYKVNWTRPNPSTFFWVRPDSRATLQRTESQYLDTRTGAVGARKQYLFQIVNQADSSPIYALNTNSQEDGFAREALENLYNAIERSLERKGIEFLKKIIPPA